MDITFSQALGNLILSLGQLLGLSLLYAAHWVLLIVWVAWWLGAVNWKKAWVALAQGGWAPLVLLVLVIALVWSRLVPAYGALNFWWQLGYLMGLVALALFCGWLQGIWHLTPAEIDLEPPVHFEHVHDDTTHHAGRDETPPHSHEPH